MIFCLGMQSPIWTSKRSKGQWLHMNKWLCSFPKEASAILLERGLGRTIPTHSFTLGAHGVRKYTQGFCPCGGVIQDGACPSWLSVAMTNTVTESNLGKRGFILAYPSRNRLLLRKLKAGLRARAQNRDCGGTLLTSLISGSCPAAFLIQPGPTHMWLLCPRDGTTHSGLGGEERRGKEGRGEERRGRHHPQWAGPSFIN